MSKASSLLRHILFADDTNQYIANKSRAGLYKNANSELKKVADWVAHNKLTLNYEKTEFIEFSKSKINSRNELMLRINGKPIRRVDEGKFLGFYRYCSSITPKETCWYNLENLA